MTQAYNLSQLANNLDTSGRLDATDGLVNAVPVANGGTGASTAITARANLDVAQAVYSVPSGGIIMWSGSVATIPTGWFLCNGANGTPNLTNRFVIGAGSSYGVAATGGSADAIVVSHSHTTTLTDPGHSHGPSGGGAFVINNNGGGNTAGGSGFLTNAGTSGGTASATTGMSVSSAAAGASGTNANLPPYYALAFIMKS
jgi:hypothetical protein